MLWDGPPEPQPRSEDNDAVLTFILWICTVMVGFLVGYYMGVSR